MNAREPLRQIVRLPARALILVARVYQVTLSPVIGGHCRYLPTCSDYFIEAVRRKGAVVGSAKGLWRILRCHPLSRGGYDPVEPISDPPVDPEAEPVEPRVDRGGERPSE